MNNLKKHKKSKTGFARLIENSHRTASKSNQRDIIKEKQALELINQGKFEEAEKIYRELISKGTKSHSVYNHLGIISGLKGNNIEKIQLLQKALELQPKDYRSLNNLGNALNIQGDYNKAIEVYRKALNLKPNYSQALVGLGNTYEAKGNRDSAIISYEKALKINPNYAEALNNLGAAIYQKGDIHIAIESYKKALKLKPNFPEALNNLGVALYEIGDLKIAIEVLKKALMLKPMYSEARFNLSRVELLIGDYKNGWNNYESRWKKINPTQLHSKKPDLPKWNGEILQPKEKLLIIGEQGLGDTIQFMRYVPFLRNQNIDVSFCAEETLHSLIKASNIDKNPLTPKEVNNISEGKWIELLSLPKYIGISTENPIVNNPYISVPKLLIRKWNDILAPEKKPIIGINWQGNPNTEKNELRGRSFPLESFSNIAKSKKFNFLSLQKGAGSEQLNNCSFINNFVNCQKTINDIWDFTENAAIIANCDLIITCDTSLAHLAGAIGAKVWLLLKDVPEWRWGIQNKTTFWYPSMRLFRQKETNNWNEVMDRLLLELKNSYKLIK